MWYLQSRYKVLKIVYGFTLVLGVQRGAAAKPVYFYYFNYSTPRHTDAGYKV